VIRLVFFLCMWSGNDTVTGNLSYLFKKTHARSRSRCCLALYASQGTTMDTTPPDHCFFLLLFKRNGTYRKRRRACPIA
jgi:hypothetical protein